MKKQNSTRYLYISSFLILILGGVLLYGSLNTPFSKQQASVQTTIQKEDAIPLQYLLGQSVMVGIQGTHLTQEEEAFIRTYGIGGVMLLEKNITSEEQVQNLIKYIQNIAEENNFPSLFIAIDQEGGEVSRIASDPTVAIEQKDITTKEKAYNTAYTRGTYLSSLGINMNFSPVIDPITSEKSFLWNRVFHTPLATRIQLAIAMIEGYKAGGITPVLKHFPGHNNTSLDTHEYSSYSFPLQTEYTQHFSSLFAQTYVPAVMISHTIAQGEEIPATLSQRDIAYLENELLYTGLTITDDLEMNALASYSPKERSIKALLSGVDILLFSGYRYNIAIHEDILSHLMDELELRPELQTSLKTRYKKITSYKKIYLP